jgi:hypothetical protein
MIRLSFDLAFQEEHQARISSASIQENAFARDARLKPQARLVLGPMPIGASPIAPDKHIVRPIA